MKILWVDDHEILCVALSEYVQAHASELSATPIDITPVFTLASALEEVNKTPPPDLVFLDLNLDGENRGAATLEHFQAGNPSNVPVVICTGLAPGSDHEVGILRMCMRDYAARGILLKGGAHKKMFIGLSRILGGELWIPEEVLLRFACSTQAPSASRNQHHLGLSPRVWDLALHCTWPLRETDRKSRASPWRWRHAGQQYLGLRRWHAGVEALAIVVRRSRKLLQPVLRQLTADRSPDSASTIRLTSLRHGVSGAQARLS